MKSTAFACALATVAACALLAVADARAQAAPNTLGKIKAAKQVNIAFSGDSLPFSYVGPNNQPAGYSIDLCNRIVASIGRAIGEPNLKVNWLVGTVSERLSMVATGKADLDCANTTMTQARLRDVDFSGLIFIDGGGLLIKADSAFNRIADLAGKRIGVIGGTTTEQRLNAALKSKLVNATVVQVREGGEGVAMLEAGSLDAFASDKVKLVGLAAQAKDPNAFALLVEEISFEPLALALPRGDSALRLEVNKALTQIYIGGEIDTVFTTWMGKLGRPSGLLAAMYLLNAIPE